MHACVLSCFSRVGLRATLWTAAHQAPPSTGFSRQEYWSGLPFPSPLRFAISLLLLCISATFSFMIFLPRNPIFAGWFDLMRAVCAFLSQESPCLTREKIKVRVKNTIQCLGKAADTFTGSLIVNKTEKGSKGKNQSSVRFSTVQYKSRLSKDYSVKLPNRLSQALS